MGKREGRTEAPTEKRKKDSRKKGEVARSADLAPWVALLVGTYLLPYTVGGISRTATEALAELRHVGRSLEPNAALHLLASALLGGFLAIAPLLAVCAGVGVLGQLAQTGIVLSTRALRPDIKRINPVAGVKRLLSVRSLWDTGKQATKALVIALLCWPRIRGLTSELSGVPLLEGVAATGTHLVAMVRTVCWAVLVLALVDYAFQRRQHLLDLRMTKQEVKEEMRQSEGDPHVKQRIRSLQASMARRRMLADVPTASVVVTNPTHVAVAIRYDPAGGGAPKVVASGTDELAARIRAAALDAAVPVVQAPPLARALWRTCQVGDEIPTALYEAVAKVLVFIRRLRRGVGAASALPLPRTYQVDPDRLESLTRSPRHRRAA